MESSFKNVGLRTKKTMINDYMQVKYNLKNLKFKS